MDGGLGETTDLWPPVKTGFGFVHRAAGILRNQEGLVGAAVREHYQDLLEQIHKAIEQDKKNRQESVPVGNIQERVSRLTPREHEVMDLLVTGQSMKQIAKKLQISLPTCSKHRANVLEKLDVDNDVQLLRRVHAWKTPPP